MGQIKKLINFDKMMRFAAVNNGANNDNYWTDIGGTLRNYNTYSGYDLIAPWHIDNFGFTYTQQTTAGSNQPNLFPHLSSNDDISYNSTTVPNEITATTSVAYTRDANGNGWTANITATGTSGNVETIRSLVFTKHLAYAYSSSSGATFGICVLFAYILDKPIELNAENDYTANLTMSVIFE